MTYEAIDRSADDGAPLELYKIVTENITHYFTDAPTPTIFEGKKYSPRQIRRTQITNTASFLDNSTLSVYLPANDALSRLVGVNVTPTDFTIEIWQKHRTDTDGEAKRIVFAFVTGVSMSGDELELSSISFMNTHVDAQVVTVAYGPICPHEWGSPRCGVDKELYAKVSTLIGLDIWSLTFADFIGEDMSNFIGGYLVNLRTGVKRNIVDIEGNYAFISGAFVDARLGDPVKLYPGCDHMLGVGGDCHSTYYNTINFGGFPLVPEDNPFVLTFGSYDYSSLTKTEKPDPGKGGE